MIKLQDFARDCGVTDRAIQKHLKKHEKELEGHFHRRGPNGTWLDETAQSYIRSLMKESPVIVGDTLQQQEVETLRKQVAVLQEKLIESQEKHISYVEHTTDLLNAAAENQKLLEASKASENALRDDLSAERQKNEELVQELEKTQEKANTAVLRAVGAEADLEDVQKRLEKAETDLEAMKNRPLWKRIFNKE